MTEPEASAIVVDECRANGVPIDPESAGYLLWNYTPWPVGDDTENDIRGYARDYLNSAERNS